MLQKLKIKLVLINVISLTVVLLLAFLFVYFLLKTRFIKDEVVLLEQVASDEVISVDVNKTTAEKFAIPDNLEEALSENEKKQMLYSTLNLFCVKKDMENVIVEISSNNFDKEETVRYLVQKVDSLGKGEREVDLNNGEVCFAFHIEEKPNGKVYVFIDITNRVETMSYFFYFAAFSWTGSMILVFGVSMFLASKAIKPVKESMENQDKFIADASHELRTPVAVIRTNTELVMDSPEMTVEENMKWLTYILNEAKRMAKLTEDLLVLSRPNTNKKIIKSEINLSVLAGSVFDSFRELFKEHNLDSELEIMPDIIILADEYGIRQMLVILLDNARKYTNEGGIKLKLEKTADNIYVKIIDTGVGISQENLGKIFERFFRVDKSRAKNKGGSGLGLSIANVIAKEHNAKITVKSELGKGSEFCVTFLPV